MTCIDLSGDRGHDAASTGLRARTIALARLAAALEAACSGPADRMGGRIREALAAAAAEPHLLTPAQRGTTAATYQRHLLAADPAGRFAVVAIAWGTQQASPVHGHRTWCGYTVLEGCLDETTFAWDDAAQCAVAAASAERARGATSFVDAGLDGIHQLRNASGSPAISLHVYGVGQQQVASHVNHLVPVAAESLR